jgi:Zn-dependent peptidase ImmA (M78 family)
LFEKATVKQTEEYKCNEFAGNFLAPANMIEQTDDLKEISNYASKLKISREVYLRRLKDENKISDLTFFRLLEQIKESYKKTEKKKGIIIKPEVKSRASRGETFYNMILEAMNNNRISYTQASSALNLNISRLLHEI